jgi:phosphatidylserine/phosphatidylglycerophosphate/cardiolipin synthase-like enzyme
MFRVLHRSIRNTDLVGSKLLNETTFYNIFLKDLERCGSELLIESPFISNRRLAILLPTLQKLKQRKVRIVINTLDPEEHDDEYMSSEARLAVAELQKQGMHVLYTSGHHRKLAVIDRCILYKGSLNILSQNNSSETMIRIESIPLAWQMIKFVQIDKFVT